MTIEPVGRDEGTPLTESGTIADVPEEPTPAIDQQMVDDGTGKMVPLTDLSKEIADLRTWKSQQSERARILNQREDYLRSLDEKYGYIEKMDKSHFAEDPGRNARLREFVAGEYYLHGTGTAPDAATRGVPAPQAPQKPEGDFVTRAELAEWQQAQAADHAWGVYRGQTPIGRVEEAAVRHLLFTGQVRTAGLSDVQAIAEAHRMVREMSGAERQRSATDQVNQIRNASLAGSTEGPGRATAGEPRKVPNVLNLSDDEVDEAGIAAIVRGDYGDLE
jgi:hypothetical protein